MKDTPNHNMTIDEVAKSLGVSYETILQWIRNGELSAISVSRNPKSQRPRIRVLRADFDKFVESRRVRQVPEEPESRFVGRRINRSQIREIVK